MFGHGAFVYRPDVAIDTFGTPIAVAIAMHGMDMRHAWLRVHGADGAWRTEANAALADALRAAGIRVGVWGWCDGNEVGRDIANALAAIDAFGPDAYIADIEPGVRGARWTPADAAVFAAAVKARLGSRPLVVSGPGFIADNAAAVMAAMDAADAFAPQAYWFDEDPVEHVKRCVNQWRRVVTKPLVITGQAYWGERPGWTEERAERQLEAFLAGFDGYGEIVGLNWWNLAAPDAMSARMRGAISAARLGQRDFAR
jgi:hypothetical protein